LGRPPAEHHEVDASPAAGMKPVEMPLAEPYRPAPVPAWLDNWRLWLGFAVALILLVYGPVLVNLVGNMQLNAVGRRVW